jgi:hypothetical protein
MSYRVRETNKAWSGNNDDVDASRFTLIKEARTGHVFSRKRSGAGLNDYDFIS